jgi:chromate transporter
MISLSEATKVWLRIGCLSFGGPAGQIALLHRELVDERKWLGEKEFLSALNFCMLLPGPEAMQLATYAGWKLHGIKGGLIAGLLFVLPGGAVILVLSLLYAMFGKQPLVESLFWGLKAAVLVIVVEALLRVAKKALKTTLDWWIAGAAFVALFAFALPFPLVIAVAGVIGLMMPVSGTVPPHVARPNLGGTFKTVAAWLAIWLAPLAALYAVFGKNSMYSAMATFFSKLAVVTFGGAYAVLTYMGQDVVDRFGWLTAPEMMDGLALAETTPGPLILVGQFVAFTAAAKPLGLGAGIAASLVFLWMTFAPCFLWIFAGAPWIEYLQSQPRLSSALSRISAAVVGVILNLSLWFAIHALFSRAERLEGLVPVWWPEWGTLNFPLLILSGFLGFVLLRWHWGIPKTLGLAGGIGLLWFTVQQSL